MQEAVTISSLLTDAATVIPETLGIVWDMVTSNPLLTLFAGAGIITMGFGFWRKAKRAAH